MRDLRDDDRSRDNPVDREAEDLRRGLGRSPAEFDVRDFESQAELAKAEVEAAHLALALTRVLKAQQEIQITMQRLDLVLAEREQTEAQRAAKLAQMIVTPEALARSAKEGAQAGSRAASGDMARHVSEVYSTCRLVLARLESETEARRQERTRWMKAAGPAAAVWVGAILLGVVGGYYVGGDAGAARGYAAARDEVAAASWANTTNGRFARKLDRDGALQLMRTCAGQNWREIRQQGRRVCFAGDKAGTQGWYLP